MYDCTLISPPSRSISHYRPPLSLIHLGGYLTHKGLKAKIVDVPMKEVVRTNNFWKNKDLLVNRIKDKMIEEVKNTDTKYIGISCYSPEYTEVRQLIFDLRRVSKAKIIIGGVHPTLCPNDFNDIADYIVRGLGEMCLYGIITEQKKVEAKSIDEFSYPNYDLVDMNYYTNANPYCIRGVYLRATYLLAGYGCPSSCTFCVAKTLRPFFGCGQMRSAGRLLEDILYLKEKYFIDGFYFIDDLFTLNKKNVLEFCELLRGRNLIWGCSSKVTTLNEDLIKSMSEAGCVQMDFGVERGSNEALKRLKKGQTVEKVKEIFSLCKKYNVRTFANYIVNIPEESERDREDIGTCIRAIKPTITSINIFRGYLGTELSDCVPTGDLERWVRRTTRRYNRLTNSFGLFNWRYIKRILKSKKRLNYLKQLWILLLEIINQKL